MHFSLMDLVTDITQNGIESGADLVELHISETINSSNQKEFRFTVKDNGKGMTQDELKRAQDPFVTDGIKHPHRKVGLGLPFLIQTAETSGGGWKMESEKGVGTEVTAWFDLDNFDTPPLGDIPGMLRTVMMFTGPGELAIKRLKDISDDRLEYEVRKSELLDVLGDLEDAQSLILLDQFLRSAEQGSEEDEEE